MATNTLRRIGEDPKLRPFLSAHFDRQSYVKNVITESESDACLTDITNCIDDINVEIKRYISKNTENLMSGMQDFALLANRYSNLSATSQKLHNNVERLKLEVLSKIKITLSIV